jgi:hypothetical protein
MMATVVARNASEGVAGSGGVCIWQEYGVRYSVLW